MKALDLGDALLVVTDGVVEVPGADIDLGLDRLLGEAEKVVLSGWAGGAQTLLDRRRQLGDDAQVLLLNRTRALPEQAPRSVPRDVVSAPDVTSLPYPDDRQRNDCATASTPQP